MQAWRGWTTAAAATKPALTWSEWCAWLQRTLHQEERHERRRPEDTLFTERERARLRFERWRYQTGRLGPPEYDSAERQAV